MGEEVVEEEEWEEEEWEEEEWVEGGVEELDTVDGAWVGQEEEFSTTLHISKITTHLMYTFIQRRPPM